MEIFEKTLAGSFSCVNTRLSFDTEILIPNLNDRDYSNISVDQSFKGYKRDDLKAIYLITLDSDRKPEKRHVITKILKLDQNNQYGFAVTKPILSGCIKEHPSPSLIKLNILL